jgi:hypothetical protein
MSSAAQIGPMKEVPSWGPGSGADGGQMAVDALEVKEKRAFDERYYSTTKLLDWNGKPLLLWKR